mmetsp:Transcript_100252/g.312364  ORF Transcript_100252/g.312364 Transcript_100252/m.312364 type:complete len:271 (-) Transcript_100252:8-820(-)
MTLVRNFSLPLSLHTTYGSLFPPNMSALRRSFAETTTISKGMMCGASSGGRTCTLTCRTPPWGWLSARGPAKPLRHASLDSVAEPSSAPRRPFAFTWKVASVWSPQVHSSGPWFHTGLVPCFTPQVRKFCRWESRQTTYASVFGSLQARPSALSIVMPVLGRGCGALKGTSMVVSRSTGAIFTRKFPLPSPRLRSVKRPLRHCSRVTVTSPSMSPFLIKSLSYTTKCMAFSLFHLTSSGPWFQTGSGSLSMTLVWNFFVLLGPFWSMHMQ